MADSKIVVSGKLNSGSISGKLQNGGMRGTISLPKVIGVSDYNALTNKPSINGVTLSGNMSTQDLQIVSENTTAGWNSNPQYLPKAGEICIYTDYMTIQDDMGNDVTYPGIKIGDGNSYLIDMPFVGDDTRYLLLRRLQEHENDAVVHVTQQDRDFWDNKLNYDVNGETLILTRL
jgi:hypothetical protein